jgi:hypothetical protein
MNEIKLPLWQVDPGHYIVLNTPYGRSTFCADGQTFIVSDKHSIADVLRHLIAASSVDEVQAVLDHVRND